MINAISKMSPVYFCCSERAVDRDGQHLFRKDFSVKGLRPPKAALRALDNKILSKHTTAIAIDGFL
jgi:hypothetical protein